MSAARLPAPVAERLRDALRRTLGDDLRLQGARPVSGGCIHHALELTTSAGPVFVKWNEGEAGRGFESEARSLTALAAAAAGPGLLRVPEVWAARDAVAGAPGFLALEFLPPSPPGPGYAEALGQGLRALHEFARGTDEAFGWPEENRIGPLPQPNSMASTWPEFWQRARIEPQLDAARAEGWLDEEDREWSDAVVDAIPRAIRDACPSPELVHGDLWSGNVHPGPDGRPVLVDPATFRGHGEVDLAMAQLFGGFDPATFSAYGPLAPGWAELRRPLYQLYFLLVHLRLFGRGYYAGTRRAAESVLRALG